MPSINGDMRQRVVENIDAMEWQPSPSKTVWRKRLHLVGEPESGQVTSIVRYDPHSSFHEHPHPQGEEILVLKGVFSDEYGDWPAGSYLLNPEGFCHTPFSRSGCELFVKLRQYGGPGRFHVAHAPSELTWQFSSDPDIVVKTLYAEEQFPETMHLERWYAGAAPGLRRYPQGAEILVLSGSLEDELGRYDALTWLRLPPGAHHRPRAPSGCELYIKRGGVSALQSA